MVAPFDFRMLGWLKPYFEVCRIESWISWVFGFSIGNVFLEIQLLEHTIAISLAFSFATASIFILNQYFDRQADKKNKVKSNLPVSSGRISPRNAVIFSLLLIISCFTLVVKVDIYLLPSFFFYITLWTFYSSPHTRLKAIPFIDFLTSGLGAGLLPFFIGSNILHNPNMNVSYILITIIFTLFHCGAHIIQTIGDYEADQEAEINTFVVKYGRKKGVKVAGFMFLSIFLSVIIYLITGLISPNHLIFFFTLLPLSIPPLFHFKYLYQNPCSATFISFQKSVKKYGTFTLLISWIYIVMVKFGL